MAEHVFPTVLLPYLLILLIRSINEPTGVLY